MKINQACSALDALGAIDNAVYAQFDTFDPKIHANLMAAIMRDQEGNFNPEALRFYPTIHKGWNIPATKRQLVLILKYLRKKCFDYEYKIVYTRINLPFYWKWILYFRSLR